MSKIRVKRQRGLRSSTLGRPRVLKRPLATKDFDSTMSYEELTTDECPTDRGEYDDDVMDVQFRISVPDENDAVPRASPPPPPPACCDTESQSDDSDGNLWDRPYVNYCFQQLRNNQLLRNLVEKLYTAECLQDFMLLITQIADGKLSPLNIAFLLCLERARWQSLKTTTLMRFRSVTKKFWLVVYRLLKGKGLRFFSGPKNYGQVISKKTKKGRYNPHDAEINFAVPDERYLCRQDQRLGRIIQPGLINESMELIQDHQDIVLMADCKRVSKGLKSDNMGDVNLWGHEHPPTLQQRLQQLQEECSYLRGRLQSLPYDALFQLHVDLKYLLQLVTMKIRHTHN